MELLIMIDSCKRASAARVTAVLPYYGYARQDRKDEGRVPITAKLVANLITRAGADRVLAMDLHAPQIQGFFDVPVDHLYAAPVLTVISETVNIRAKTLWWSAPTKEALSAPLAFPSDWEDDWPSSINAAKMRSDQAEEHHRWTVEGKICLMFDDMISTGSSICGAAKLVHEAGAAEIHLACTHGVLCGDAIKRIKEAPVNSVVITNTIPLPPEKRLDRIQVLSVARSWLKPSDVSIRTNRLVKCSETPGSSVAHSPESYSYSMK